LALAIILETYLDTKNITDLMVPRSSFFWHLILNKPEYQNFLSTTDGLKTKFHLFSIFYLVGGHFSKTAAAIKLFYARSRQRIG
jgi:hypothetical protein